MGHKSRLSKQLSPDIFFKRNTRNEYLNSEVDQFWAWFRAQCLSMAKRFPKLWAGRSSEGERAGEWVLHGDIKAIRAFKDLAVDAGRRIGSHAGPEEAVQFWLAHLNGDHVQMRKEPVVDPKSIDYFTQHSDGTREMHMGRYKQTGVDWTSAPENRKKLEPLKVPDVIVPKSEPLIKVVGS